MNDVSEVVCARLQSLLCNIHLNCLVLLDLMHQRVKLKAHDPTVELENGMNAEHLDFDMLIRAGRYLELRKGDHVKMLKQQNGLITNVVQQLCRKATSKLTLSRGGGSSRGS